MARTAPASTAETKSIPQLKVVFCGLVSESAPCYTSPLQVAEFLSDDMQQLDREAFYVLHLNGKNQIIAKELISLGSLNQSIVHPREVFKGALLNNAAAIIGIHNHPSGNPEPSIEDKNITKRLKDAAEILGIKFLDHIILGYTDKGFRYHSLLQQSPANTDHADPPLKPIVKPLNSYAPYQEQNKWVAPLRKQAGLTQKRLAESTGLKHQAEVSDIERGWREIGEELEKKIRSILGQETTERQSLPFLVPGSSAFLSEWLRLKSENKPDTILFFEMKNEKGGHCYTAYYKDVGPLKICLDSLEIEYYVDADLPKESCVIEDKMFDIVTPVVILAGYQMAICSH